MRYLHLLLAAFLLASSVTASACHGVGDVHVICKDGAVRALYVEDKGVAAETATPDCCPMAGFALADNAIGALKPKPETAQTPDLAYHAPSRRTHAPAQPRGPPAQLFF